MKTLKNLIAIYSIVTVIFAFSPFVNASDTPPSDLNSSITSKINGEVANININPNPQVNPTINVAPTNSANDTNVANTGDNTNVDSANNQNSTTEANNTNGADINQQTNAYANTGDNEAEKNIAINGNAGVIMTGDAIINVDAKASANNNSAVINSGSSNGSNSTNVNNTGNNMTTTTSSSGTNTLFLNQGNWALIHQGTNATANTGNNKARGNISVGGMAGVIITGNTSINTNYLVAANGNVAIVGGTAKNGGPGSGASIYILNGGDMFKATSVANQNHYLIVTNENRALISQTCGVPEKSLGNVINASNCIASTGGNNASNNIALNGDAGVIHTQDAVVNVNMRVSANNNLANVDNSDNCPPTETNAINSGDNSSVNNSANCQSNTAVNNSNYASVNQNVNAVAETGKNRANRNIAINGNAGIITTGDAIINVSMEASVNDNQTVINEPSASLEGGPQSTTNVVNTGNNAQINTSSNKITNINVNQTNNLVLNQTVEANQNTGGNDVSDNLSVGGSAGYIKTGNNNLTINMKASGNSNKTIIGDPIDNTSDPQLPASVESVPTSTPSPAQNQQIQNVADVISNNNSNANSILSSVSGVAYTLQTLALNTAKKAGKVLGTKAKKLPATGAEDTILLFAIILSTLTVGSKLRRFRYKEVSL